ncbi:MAG: ABC transporter substrate-binding protein, partial [Bifidobacteriaceae bacterium]|nr:ABC transporter substrate-binding protein [Bifidobacteriaceae bacterium]
MTLRTIHATPRGRRIRLVAALGVGSLALGLASCSSDDPDASSSDEPTSQGRSTLTIAEQNPPNNMNPALTDANADFVVISYDALTREEADGSLSPSLAKSWELSEGNTKLDLVLRDDVTFSDGTALDAAAVVASLEYARDAGGANASVLEGAQITSSGAGAVTITVPSPNPMLPTQLSQGWGIGNIISPAGLADPDSLTTDKPSQGAGPYVYDPAQSVAGDHYTYTARSDYYEASLQYFEEIVIRVISDQQTALNAATTGQVDVFVGDYSVAAQAEKAGLATVSAPTLTLGMLFFDRDGQISEAVGDLKVRQAINYAIDRDSVATALLGEGGLPAVQVFAPDSPPYSQADANAYAYDQAKARALLAEAGYPDGVTIDVITAGFAGFDTVAEAIKAQVAEVGITLNVTIETEGPAWVGAIVSSAYPAGVQGMAVMPPFLECTQVLLPSAQKVLSPFGSTNPEIEALCAELGAADPTSDTTAIQQRISAW